MTATTSPAPAPQMYQWGPVLWTIALVWSVVIALFGVNAAIGSVQRKQYAEARVAAVYLLSNGNTINGSMQRLNEVNVRDCSGAWWPGAVTTRHQDWTRSSTSTWSQSRRFARDW